MRIGANERKHQINLFQNLVQNYLVNFTNKNYKRLQGTNIMHLQLSTIIENQERPSYSFESDNFNEALPLKLSSTKQVVIIRSLLEEIKFLNTVIWRQNTSMPIAQVLSFKNQVIDSSYPRTYSLEIQSIEKSINNLYGIQLKDSLYLIQQCLLGVQALTYKFHSFDFQSVFYGLNDRGECRTWFSHNLLEYQPSPLPLPSEQIIINHIVKMIYSNCSENTKRQLFEFVQQTAKHINIGYTEMHLKLNQFVNRKGIFIPNCVNVERRQSLIFKARSQIIRDTNSQERISLKPSYQSPNKGYTDRKSQCQQVCSKQNFAKCGMTWHSQFIPNNSPLIKLSKLSFQDKTNCQFSIRTSEKRKSVENMLMKSHKLKNKLKQSKDSFKCSMKGSTRKLNYSFAPQDKSQKTCTSLTFPGQNLVCNLSKSGMNSKTSQKNNEVFSSIYLSQNYHIEVNEPKQKQKQKKHNMSESSFHYMRQNYHHHTSGSYNYNFGGLLPLPEKSIKQSQEVEQQFFQPKYQPKLLSDFHADRAKMLKSLVLSQNDIKFPYHNAGWQWQNKMSKLITQDRSNLKQSVYCGEQKKPQPLQIKLQKLGKLGRQITSAVLIQQNQQ